MTDDDDNGLDTNTNVKTIKPNEAVEIFKQALYWAQCENVEQNELNVLRRLGDKDLFQVLLT